MNEPHDHDRTADASSAPADSLDAGLAAGFGRPAAGPRSSLGAAQRPVVLKEAEGESADIVKPRTDAMPAPEQAGDRYQLFGEIARGGMGAVLRGRDVDLGRDLAVKVLLEKYVHRPEVARRFLDEAQVGAQLQHPGIVPVYDVGRFGERPFFTMKLVKGHTLAALLAERGQPTDDRPRLLGVALKVSEAMAYAHAKGVIHRDLKPANVMVGAFGEVQVMDWGLAKVLQEGGVADEERAARQHQDDDGTQIRTARSGTAGSHGSDTEAGSLLGTPPYMPPEQANGDVANLDRRTDVFALGAMLCEILTGLPPYVGRTVEEVRRKAANGDLADALARLGGCGADQELITLTKKCLSPEATDRPRDAQEVADGLSAYLDGVEERLRAAQRDRAVAVVRASEERRRRRVQLALAAAVMALLLGGGAFAWWRNEQAQAGRERDARNVEAVTALLSQAEEALQASDAAKAKVALEAARRRSDEGGAQGQAQRLDRLEADWTLLGDLDDLEQFRSTWSANGFPGGPAVAARTREALRRFGADPDAVSVDEAAVRVSASAVRERIVAALDQLLGIEKTAAVRAALQRVDADPERDAVRDAVLAGNWAKFDELMSRDAILGQPPGFVALVAVEGGIPVQRQRQLLEAVASRRPDDLGLLLTLGNTYSLPRRTLARGAPIGQAGGADKALRWFQAAVAAAPANAASHGSLGLALLETGDLDGAIACFRRAVDLSQKSAVNHANLGVSLYRKGQLGEAVACYRRAVELDPRLPEAHNGLGNALRDQGQSDEAIACYRRAVALDPEGFPGARANLGWALQQAGQIDDSVASYKKALELDPNLPGVHANLGKALQMSGRIDEAVASYRKAIALDPRNALALDGLGLALADRGQVDEAIECFRKVIELDPKNAMAHTNLGTALVVKGQPDGAIACFKKALELDPRFVPAHRSLGVALENKGRAEEAVACYRKALELDPKDAEANCNLGLALATQGRFAESLAALRKGHDLGTKQPGWRYPSAEWVRRAEANAALEAKLPALLKGEPQPDGNGERLALAGVCHAKKLYRAAAGLWADAFAADGKLADDLEAAHRYNAACAAALAAAGQGEDAVKLDDRERTRLRKQALDWLRADLAQHTKRVGSDKPANRAAAQQVLRHWQQDTDLAGLRDKAALANLPAEEQKAFARLWADVAATLKKAEK